MTHVDPLQVDWTWRAHTLALGASTQGRPLANAGWGAVTGA